MFRCGTDTGSDGRVERLIVGVDAGVGVYIGVLGRLYGA